MRDLETIKAINADPAAYYTGQDNRSKCAKTWAIWWVGSGVHPREDVFENGEHFTTFVRPDEYGHVEWPLHKDSWALMAQAEQFDAEEIYDTVEIKSIVGVDSMGELFILTEFMED